MTSLSYNGFCLSMLCALWKHGRILMMLSVCRLRVHGYNVISHPRLHVHQDLSCNHGGRLVSLRPVCISPQSSENVCCHLSCWVQVTSSHSLDILFVIYHPGSQPLQRHFFEHLSSVLMHDTVLHTLQKSTRLVTLMSGSARWTICLQCSSSRCCPLLGSPTLVSSPCIAVAVLWMWLHLALTLLPRLLTWASLIIMQFGGVYQLHRFHCSCVKVLLLLLVAGRALSVAWIVRHCSLQ